MTPNPKRFPRYIDLPDGNRTMVHDHQTMSAMLGQEYDHNAELVVAQSATPQPPTLDTVIAAGYSPEVAAKIVEEEQRKFAAGIKPYGEQELVAPSDAGALADDEALLEMFTKARE